MVIRKIQVFENLKKINMNIEEKEHFWHIKWDKKKYTINISLKLCLLIDYNVLSIINKKKVYVTMLLKILQLIFYTKKIQKQGCQAISLVAMGILPDMIPH